MEKAFLSKQQAILKKVPGTNPVKNPASFCSSIRYNIMPLQPHHPQFEFSCCCCGLKTNPWAQNTAFVGYLCLCSRMASNNPGSRAEQPAGTSTGLGDTAELNSLLRDSAVQPVRAVIHEVSEDAVRVIGSFLLGITRDKDVAIACGHFYFVFRVERRAFAVRSRQQYMFKMFYSVLPFVIELDDPEDMPQHGNPDLPEASSTPCEYFHVCPTWNQKLWNSGCCKLTKARV